jgi:heme/copper-type cytochrome/quinol oxidase subunit 2
MGIGISLILIATGAVLAFAVTATAQGVDIATVGWILMVVGIIGLVFSMLFLASFAPFGGTRDDHTHRDPHPHA